MRNTNNAVRFAVGIALLAQVGWVQSAQAMGQIAYFENQCPDGWEEYRALTGRVVVGAGNYIQDVGSRREAQRYRSGATGGEMQHVLTAQEMPKHKHTNGVMAHGHIHGGGSLHPGKVGWIQGPSELYWNANTSSVGGNRPHNNMQPYLVLVACEKTVDELAAIRERLNRLENPR